MFDTTTIENIKEYLTRNGQTIGVAESVTTGLLQAALASADHAIDFFEGGITTYNIDQKVTHLKIDRKKGEECNCVSAQTADEMAIGACMLFKCTWGISITGYATPVPESNHKLLAYYSISCLGEIKDSGRIDLEDQKPEDAQLKYVNMILHRLEKILQ